MAKNRTITALACEICKERNYTQLVSKKRGSERLLLKKYCARCKKHNVHKETRKL